MRSLETVAEIQEDGTLSVRAPASFPRGTRRVVIVIDDAETAGRRPRRRLPDLTAFRASQGGRPYPGNSVVDMRNEER